MLYHVPIWSCSSGRVQACTLGHRIYTALCSDIGFACQHLRTWLSYTLCCSYLCRKPTEAGQVSLEWRSTVLTLCDQLGAKSWKEGVYRCITQSRKQLRNSRFAAPRQSVCLYLNLGLLACDKIRLINSTVFACSSVFCPVFVLYLWMWHNRDDYVDHCNTVCRSKKINTLISQPCFGSLRYSPTRQ